MLRDWMANQTQVVYMEGVKFYLVRSGQPPSGWGRKLMCEYGYFSDLEIIHLILFIYGTPHYWVFPLLLQLIQGKNVIVTAKYS